MPIAVVWCGNATLLEVNLGTSGFMDSNFKDPKGTISVFRVVSRTSCTQRSIRRIKEHRRQSAQCSPILTEGSKTVATYVVLLY